MSRLLNPGIGDICDRLTILSLKILHAPPERSTEHFTRERNGLLTKVQASTLNGSWFEHVLTLGAVNAALWQAEDRIREWTKKVATAEDADRLKLYLIEAGTTGIKIGQLNDRRAQLVRTINELSGDSWEEKQ